MNQIALDFIKAREKCRLIAYQDSGGKWTVGWGSTCPSIGPDTNGRNRKRIRTSTPA